jgi:hypothetical protein
MARVNKFWGRNSPPPLHDVTHRQIGDIPGCTPAPRDSIYRPQIHEDAQAMNNQRADVYERCFRKWEAGEYPGDGNTSLREMWSEISRTNGPMYGAYGEKL